jgi:hypothetical protein
MLYACFAFLGGKWVATGMIHYKLFIRGGGGKQGYLWLMAFHSLYLHNVLINHWFLPIAILVSRYTGIIFHGEYSLVNGILDG